MSARSEIPVISIQCDWNEVLRQSGGEAWISCKFRNEKSSHGKLTNQGMSNGLPQIIGFNGFSVGRITKSTLQVTHTPSENSCVFIAPCRTYTGIHSKSIVSLGVTSNGLCVSSCTENKLQVWDAEVGMVRRSLVGHIGEVYKCRFFPSGVVVLSGGADMALKIWSAETGQCPVTLSGHTAAIMDTCIVERGRNIISVSKDGTAKLWDCGQAACLETLIKVNSSINCCHLGIANNKMDLGEPEKTPNDREIGTNDKVLILGCEDGSVHAIAVHSRQILLSATLPSAVNCIAFMSDYQFVAGCQDGQVLLFAMQQGMSTPIKSWFESNSPAMSILPYKQHGFFVGKADGSCIYYRLPSVGNNANIRIQLTGPDCDPVYDIASDGTYIYTACRDALLRKYEVHKVIEDTFKY